MYFNMLKALGVIFSTHAFFKPRLCSPILKKKKKEIIWGKGCRGICGHFAAVLPTPTASGNLVEYYGKIPYTHNRYVNGFLMVPNMEVICLGSSVFVAVC